MHRKAVNKKITVFFLQILKLKLINIFSRSILDVDKYHVRLLDTGDNHERLACDIFTLNPNYQTLPDQAYRLHLTGVIPADNEDDWDSRVCVQMQNYLHKLFDGNGDKETNLVYEANILFSLRNTIVVDIIRIIDPLRGVVCSSLKAYLRNKSFGILSHKSRDKVIEMAKNTGKNNSKHQFNLLKYDD